MKRGKTLFDSQCTTFMCSRQHWQSSSISDVDECSLQGCKANAECSNFNGGYNCDCSAGYKNSSAGGPKAFDCVSEWICLFEEKRSFVLLVSEGKLSVMHSLRLSGEILCQIFLVHPRCTLGGSTKFQTFQWWATPPGNGNFSSALDLEKISGWSW